MSSSAPSFQLTRLPDSGAILQLCGDWTLGQAVPHFDDFTAEVAEFTSGELQCDCAPLGAWDSVLMAFLLQCHNYCLERSLEFKPDGLPEGAARLLEVSTAVKALQAPAEEPVTVWDAIDPRASFARVINNLKESMAFIGDVTIGMGRLAIGRANTRKEDFFNFIYQAGPAAFGIISLTSFLVGMILAYLGAAQLAQFGAQIYVADLVTIGMLREMGALMTAVVIAGRTGAAYAAQLGTMQTREEIDAIVTLGISPIEFLVLPRMLALVIIMPLLCLYADMIGMLGGALVAAGMDVSLVQFMGQAREAVSFTHLGVGLFKSTVFAVLIAFAGCRAGMQCGRSSAARRPGGNPGGRDFHRLPDHCRRRFQYPVPTDGDLKH